MLSSRLNCRNFGVLITWGIMVKSTNYNSWFGCSAGNQKVRQTYLAARNGALFRFLVDFMALRVHGIFQSTKFVVSAIPILWQGLSNCSTPHAFSLSNVPSCIGALFRFLVHFMALRVHKMVSVDQVCGLGDSDSTRVVSEIRSHCL